jgi:pimeloyl-ACP methyl ester carboxylesterase
MTTNWTAEERSAKMLFHFDDGSFYEQNIIEQSLDPGNANSTKFCLYYFVKDQTYDNEKKPTVLFAAGGPGQMILPDTENFADMYGYRTVYFHLRGTGFSQLPDNAEADRYIRTAYVVEDIEKIREDVLGVAQWSAVIGHSYGALVAQCYARFHPESVKKVILSAPMVPTSILRRSNNNHTAGEKLTFESLRRIYKTKPFRFLDSVPDGGGIREYLVRRAQEISQEIEDRFGSVQFVGDNYDDLNKELKGAQLDYGQSFFGAIRRLRNVGWLPLDVPYAKPISTPKVDDTQVQCGLVIANVILKKEKGFELEKVFEKGDILKGVLDDGKRLFRRKSTQNTARPYYLISTFDGLNEKLVESFKAKRGFPLGGGVTFNHPMTRLIRDQSRKNHLKTWKEDELETHGKPTLILKAAADPVTQQGEAEYYFDNAVLDKEKILVEFPGVGHAMALPDLDPSDADLLKTTVNIKGEGDEARILSPRDKLIDNFLSVDSVETLKNSKFVQALGRAFDKCFEELDQDVTGDKESRVPNIRTGYA